MIQIILNLLKSDGYISTNKNLIKNIGLTPAIVFSELCSKYAYFLSQGLLKDGFFYFTIPDCEQELNIGRKEQDNVFNKLISFGLITKKVMKLKNDEAPKRYIKITDDINLLMSYLKEKSTETVDKYGFVQKEQIENTKMDISICPKGAPNKNKYIILSNDNQLVSSSYGDSMETEGETDGLTDLFQKAKVDLFEDEPLKETLKETITELHQDRRTTETVKKIDIFHIDTAIAKFREAQQEKEIKNPKLYFKRCLLSAIEEGGLRNIV
jgi:hypothetical protein